MLALIKLLLLCFSQNDTQMFHNDRKKLNSDENSDKMNDRLPFIINLELFKVVQHSNRKNKS